MSYAEDRKRYRQLLAQWGQGLKNLDVDEVRSMAATSMSTTHAKMAPATGIDNIVTYLRQNNFPRLVVCKLYPAAFTKTGRKPHVVMAMVEGKSRKVAVFDGKGLEVGSAYNFTLGWKASCNPVFEVKKSKKTGKRYIQGLRSDGKGSGFHHRYFKLSGNRAAQMTFITDLKVAIKNAYEEANITDAVIIDENLGSVPYALYKKNRQAVTAMKYRGKTTIQGTGTNDEPSSSSIPSMEEQDDDDDSGNLAKKMKTGPGPTSVHTSASYTNTQPVVNTVKPAINPSLDDDNSPLVFPSLGDKDDVYFFKKTIDKNVHDLLDDLGTLGYNNSISMAYDYAERVVAREKTAMEEVTKSSAPQFEMALADLIVRPSLAHFYSAYNLSPDVGGLVKSVLADVFMDAVEKHIDDDVIEFVLEKYFEFVKDKDANVEEDWLTYLEEHQVLQYDSVTHEITWPDQKMNNDIFEGPGTTAYINPASSATS